MSLSFKDWQTILGLDNFFEDLYAGLMPIDAARLLVISKRSIYPNVPFDYIKVLDEFDKELDTAQEALDEQNTMLEDLEDALDEVGVRFEWDENRFLNEAQKDDLEDFERDIGGVIRDAEDSLELIGDSESEIEDLRDELDIAMSEAEDAQSEYEEYLEDLYEWLELVQDGSVSA